MNKHYITLALLMSTCTSGLIEAKLIIQTGSDECTSLADVQNEKQCTTRGTPFQGKCVTDLRNDGTTIIACRYEGTGSIFSSGTRSNNSRDSVNTDNRAKLEENSNSANMAEAKSAPTNFSTYIFSQNINTPIYNLPMQRTLVALSHGTIDCPWFFSFAPYGKTTQKQTIGNAELENTEAGTLLQGGYYGSYWFANTIASFGWNKTDAHAGDTLNVSHWHVGFTDALFMVGLKTDSDRDATLAANGAVFFGVSANRLGGDDFKDSINKSLFNVGNPSTGVQGEIDWTFATFDSCKFELSAFSRFTHFFKKTIEIDNQQISYTPGSFVDVLVGLTQYYGSDYQHQFEIGYNPTVRVMKAEALNEKDAAAANLNDPETGKLHHTAYATYSYNWETNGMPMTFSLGGSATVAPHTNTYGTVFGTFGLNF